MSADHPWLAVAPAFAEGVTLEQAPGGAWRLVAGDGRQVDVPARWLPLVRAVDGRHTMAEVLELALEGRVFPLEALEILRTLASRGLLSRSSGAAILGGRGARRLLGLLDLRLYTKALAPVVAPGRWLPRWWWPLFHLLAGLGMAALLLLLTLRGERLDPTSSLGPDLTSWWVPYGALAGILSLRGLVRGLAMRSLGVPVPRAGLRILWGVPLFDVDQRHRSGAPRYARLHMALAGMSSLAAVASVAGLLHFWGRGSVGLAALASLALVVSTLPYAKGDLWHLQGILTLVPRFRHKTLHFITRRLGWAILSGPREEHRPYLFMTSIWLGHGVISIYLLGDHFIPSLLDRLVVLLTVADPSRHLPALLGLGLAAFGLLVLLAFLGLGMIGVALVVLIQVFAPRAPARPRSRAVSDPGEISRRAMTLAGCPLFGELPQPVRYVLAARMVGETHRGGKVLLEPGVGLDRALFLVQGSLHLFEEDPSGERRVVAVLEPGACLGEGALVSTWRPRFGVRASGLVRVLSLSRDELHGALAAMGTHGVELLARLRDAALLRRVPGLEGLPLNLLARLLDAAREQVAEPGETVVSEGDRAQTLFVVASGRCEVVGRDEQELASLGPGQPFGDSALIPGGVRRASVVAQEACRLLALPGDEVKGVILEQFAGTLARLGVG